MNYPDLSLFDLIELTAHKYQDSCAYTYMGTNRTYGDFIADINKCAKALKALGLEKGDAVAICMPNTPEAVTAFYAINQIGAVANMIHPLSAENEIKHYLNISKSKVLFIIDMAWDKIQKILPETDVKTSIALSVSTSMPFWLASAFYITKGRKISKPRFGSTVLNWDSFIKKGSTYQSVTNIHLKSNDAAVILYSGGTTGTSKGIVLSNLNFNAVAIQSIEACGTVAPGHSFLSIMPIFHGFGLGVCFHTAFYIGGNAIILPSFNAKDFGNLLKKHKPNVIAGVPTLYEALLASDPSYDLDMSFVICAVSGGDTLSVKLKNEIDTFFKQRNSSVEVREGYGLTESTTACCLSPAGRFKEGSIGIPYPDMLFKIVKPDTQTELAPGEDGEIVINGPSVMLGYLNEAEETKKVLRAHDDGKVWLHTGDIGAMDEDGFIYFKQRINHIIVTSGYNIYPQNIESVINSHPLVFLSTVVGIDHPYKKQVAKAFVILKDNVLPDDATRTSILDHCKENLAVYSLPAEIEFRESLPKTIVGKIAYQTLVDEENQKKSILGEGEVLPPY